MSANSIGAVARVHVTGDGDNVTGQAGTHLLGRIAGRFGITEGLSAAMAGTIRRSSAHDRGTVLTQLAMMIAAGGRCVSDLRALRDQPRVSGTVASDVTAWRVAYEVDADRRGAIVAARPAACRRLLVGADLGEITLDVDAMLIQPRLRGQAGRGSELGTVILEHVGPNGAARDPEVVLAFHAPPSVAAHCTAHDRPLHEGVKRATTPVRTTRLRRLLAALAGPPWGRLDPQQRPSPVTGSSISRWPPGQAGRLERSHIERRNQLEWWRMP